MFPMSAIEDSSSSSSPRFSSTSSSSSGPNVPSVVELSVSLVADRELWDNEKLVRSCSLCAAWMTVGSLIVVVERLDGIEASKELTTSSFSMEGVDISASSRGVEEAGRDVKEGLDEGSKGRRDDTGFCRLAG